MVMIILIYNNIHKENLHILKDLEQSVPVDRKRVIFINYFLIAAKRHKSNNARDIELARVKKLL